MMASSLRRRGSKGAIITAKDSTVPILEEDAAKPDEKLALVPVASLEKHKQKNNKGVKRRTGLIFFLGGLFGIMVAGFFAQRNDLIDFPEFSDLGLDSLMDVLPAGLIQEAKALSVCCKNFYCKKSRLMHFAEGRARCPEL
jgi:phospholipid:diacylglycerol acyltransferase